MKLSLVAYLFVLFVKSYLLAQVGTIKKYSFEVGVPYDAFSTDYNYFFSQGDNLMSVKVDDREIIIQKYDAYELVQKTLNRYKVLPKGATVLGVYEHESSYYLFYSIYESLYSRFVACEIDFYKGVLLDEKVVIEIDDEHKFGLFQSSEKSKLLVVFEEENTDVYKGGYCVLGQKLVIESKEVVLSNEPRTFCVSNAGTVSFVVTEFDPTVKDTKRNRDELKNYVTYCYLFSSREERKIRLEGLTGNAVSAILEENINGHLICAGYAQQGMFYYLLGEELKIVGQGIRGLPWVDHLHLKDIHVQKDGSLIVIGEQYTFIKDDLIDSDGEAYTSYRNQYGSVLVSKITEKGQFNWVKSIPKKQIHQQLKPMPSYLGSMSYKYLHLDGEHVFLYLDSRLNKGLPLENSINGYDVNKAGVLTSVTIDDSTGDIKKSIILDTKYVGAKQIFGFSKEKVIPISSTEFVLEMFQRKEGDVLLRIIKRG
jgi:hypothetical protein